MLIPGVLIGLIFGYWLRVVIEAMSGHYETKFQDWCRSREWEAMSKEERGRARYRAMRPEEFDPVQLDDPSDDWKK